VVEHGADGPCVRDTLRLVLWWIVRRRGERLVDVLLGEQRLEGVEIPARDGLVELPHGAVLRRRGRLGETHIVGVGVAVFGMGWREREREGSSRAGSSFVCVFFFFYPAGSEVRPELGCELCVCGP
jgi:hypothetical protein